MIKWKEQRFSDLTTKELYEIFKLRCEVFVVEQEILYNDFDDKDYKAIHLSGFKGDELIAYGRIFEKGDYYPNNPGFGRVATLISSLGYPRSCLLFCSSNNASKLMPPTLLAVPGKDLSIISSDRPTASNILAPL